MHRRGTGERLPAVPAEGGVVNIIPADWTQVPLRFTGVSGFAHVMRHEGDEETGYVVWCRCGWSSGSRSYETGAVEKELNPCDTHVVRRSCRD